MLRPDGIETEDFHEDIKPDVESRFDTSDFPEHHPSGIQSFNKKVIGMMKDEVARRSFPD